MNTKESYFQWANMELFSEITGKITGKSYRMRDYTYGVLVPDVDHPLSAVSVSNNSLSIDVWKGCSWQCSYCHAQGTLQDISDNGKMPKKPERRNKFSISEIVDALIEHPFFIPDVSIISIGTASTEPFAPGIVEESTFEIMNTFVQRGLRNPFWIITKGGIPQNRKLDFARIVNKSKAVIVSLCWADSLSTVEPVRNNRFIRAEEAKEAGVHVMWYMRPIVKEWNGDSQRIEMMISWVKKHYGDIVDMIVPGGFRWTEGIEYGLTEIYGISMPDIVKNDNVKDLDLEIWDIIFNLGKMYFPNTPIYRRSSCSLTKILGVESIVSVQTLDRHSCENSICPFNQRRICADARMFLKKKSDIQKIFDQLGIPAKVVSFDSHTGEIVSSPSINTFSYTIRQTILKHITAEG